MRNVVFVAIVALCAATISAGCSTQPPAGAVTQSAQLPCPDLGPSPRCVSFYEKSKLSRNGGVSSCCTDEGGNSMKKCWNDDEARSMQVNGPKGTVITVFDSPDGETDDDYFVLEKLDDESVCVDSFERGDVYGGKVRWRYSGGNGLDGKVSTYRWSDVDPVAGNRIPRSLSSNRQ